jgi:exonuclease SbcC
MTVIYGVNESAKSSWHAAVYSALCGRRRGKGAPTREERRYTDLHKPWDVDQWRVSAVIRLDDGRRIELTQDLSGKVDCRAIDLDLSRDVSADVMFEGAPDGSRYLGLDRKSFAVTACVSQAELMSVLNVADGLQEHLQRAAATGGTDATAAAALSALDRFARESVGRDQANSTRPLRAARVSLEQAEQALAAARSDHADYLQLVARAEASRENALQRSEHLADLESRTAALDVLLNAARARDAAVEASQHAASQADQRAREATELHRRLARVRELLELTGGTAPLQASGQDQHSTLVAAALATWHAAPEPQPPPNPPRTCWRRALIRCLRYRAEMSMSLVRSARP